MNISRATAEDPRELLETLKEYVEPEAGVEEGPYGDIYPNKEASLLGRMNKAIEHLRFPDDPS